MRQDLGSRAVLQANSFRRNRQEKTFQQNLDFQYNIDPETLKYLPPSTATCMSVSCDASDAIPHWSSANEISLLGLQFDGRCHEFHCQRSFRTLGSLGNPFPSQRRLRKTDAVKQ